MSIYKEEETPELQVAISGLPYFPLSQGKFLILSVLNFSFIVMLYLIGSSDVDSSPIVSPSRFLLIYLGPLFSFLGYLTFAIFLFYEETRKNYFKTIFQYALVSGLISILFALTLNSRSVIIGILIAFQYDETLGFFISAAVIGPFIEEVAKALPILYISRGLSTKSGESEESRIIKNAQIPVFVGFLTGAMFASLETYWFTWNIGDIFDLDNSETWSDLSLQVILRSINPLHILTTSIVGAGIAYSVWSNPYKILIGKDYGPAIIGFVIATVIHGIWNGSLVIADENTRMVSFLDAELPFVNFIMIFLILGALPILLYNIKEFSQIRCDYCNEWHAPPYTPENHSRTLEFRTPLYHRFLKLVRRSKYGYHCSSCKNRLDSGKCQVCGASTLYVCQRCKAPIPVHAAQCWNCQLEIQPVFNKVFSYKDDKVSIISKQIIYIMAGFYIPSTITILILIIQNYSSPDERSQFDRLGIIFLFLMTLGITYLIIVRWLTNPYRLSMGYSLSRTVLSMLIVQLSVLFIAFGLLLIFEARLSEFLISGIFFLIEGIILLGIGISVILNFRPLFHEIDNEVMG